MRSGRDFQQDTDPHGRPPELKWIEQRFPKPLIPVQFGVGVPACGRAKHQHPSSKEGADMSGVRGPKGREENSRGSKPPKLSSGLTQRVAG